MSQFAVKILEFRYHIFRDVTQLAWRNKSFWSFGKYGKFWHRSFGFLWHVQWHLPTSNINYGQLKHRTEKWLWKRKASFISAMSQFAVIYVWSCRKLMKVTVHVRRRRNCMFRISVSKLKLQKSFTANWDILQKSGFSLTYSFYTESDSHTSGRVRCTENW